MSNLRRATRKGAIESRLAPPARGHLRSPVGGTYFVTGERHETRLYQRDARRIANLVRLMDGIHSDFRCPRCGANLLLTRTKGLPKGREQAFCPARSGPLMARDGDDTLG
jgi:hypothetical protein